MDPPTTWDWSEGSSVPYRTKFTCNAQAVVAGDAESLSPERVASAWYARYDKYMDTKGNALQVISNTGPARLDSDGAMIDSGEYVAALYESYVADQEAWTDETSPAYNTLSASRYAGTAGRLAEELWERDIEELEGF